MNYIETFLSKLGLNEQSESSCEDNSPNESGQFQVIDCDEDFIQDNFDKQKDFEINSQAESKQSLKNASLTSYNGHEKQPFKNGFTNQQKHQKKNPQKPQSPDQVNELEEQPSPQYPLVDLKPSKGSASTIQLDQFYMIVSTQELTKKFISEQDWNSFYSKINEFNSQTINMLSLNVSLGCSSTVEKKKQKLSLNITQLNSILEIQPHELQKRTEFWNNVAHPPVEIKFKCTELANKKDPKRLQQYVTKLLTSLAPEILKTIHDQKLKPISNVQDQVQMWKSYLIRLLTLYGANDKQIGYSKGLEYIALGILVAKPFSNKNKGLTRSSNSHPQSTQTSESQEDSSQITISKHGTYTQLETHFQYLMFTKQLRNMYFPGTPKLYQQIHLLTEQMKTQVPEIVAKLQSLKVDFVKLFINYYKTFLLYKIKNPEVIRKVMELLLIYGIDIVRIILTRIMNRNEKKILEIDEQMDLLKYLAESLVDSYFGHSNSAEVIAKFKHLFILDSST